MPVKTTLLLLGLSFLILPGSAIPSRPAISKNQNIAAIKATGRSIAPYFIHATAKKKTPDADGFIQRWSLLEPINKSIRSNVVFTDDYLKAQFGTEYFPNQFTVIPKDGEIVKVVQDSDVTNVRIKDVSDDIIAEYVDGGHYKGKAGAYNISDPEFRPLLDGFDGSYTNVMGMPIEKVEKILQEL